MNKWKNLPISLLLFCMAFILCSCDRCGSPKQEPATINMGQERESTMELITSQELLQIIRDNDTGITEDDFEGIDIDDFIAFCRFPTPSKREDTRLLNLRPHLDRYLNHLEMKLYDTSQFLALELVRVNSTDEEYEAFIEAFFRALDMEYVDLGITRDGLDSYVVYGDNNRDSSNGYYLYIGRTVDIRKYKIEGEGPFALHLGGGFFETTVFMDIFCDKESKFFLCMDGPSGGDFHYVILKTFTEVMP